MKHEARSLLLIPGTLAVNEKICIRYRHENERNVRSYCVGEMSMVKVGLWGRCKKMGRNEMR